MTATRRSWAEPFKIKVVEPLKTSSREERIEAIQAASEFAAAAKTGDRDKALALLPNLTSACVACHFSYRTR